MEIIYKRSHNEHKIELDTIHLEFQNRHHRGDTHVKITIKKKSYEDKTIEIKFKFECNKEEDGPSYEELEEVEEHMSTSIYYWITLELEKVSQFKDVVKQCNKINGKDGKVREEGDIQEKIDIFLHDIFYVYDQMITRIKSF